LEGIPIKVNVHTIHSASDTEPGGVLRKKLQGVILQWQPIFTFKPYTLQGLTVIYLLATAIVSVTFFKNYLLTNRCKVLLIVKQIELKL